MKLGDIVRSLLQEGVGRNVAEIPFDTLDNSTNSSMTTLYRVAFSNQLDSIFRHGYSRDFTGSKGGNMYGPGVYCTFRLADSIHNVKTKSEYGDCIVEMRLVGSFNEFIIFDERLARRVYGHNWRIEDQLVNVAGFQRDYAENLVRRISNYSDLYHGRTAGAAYELWSTVGHKLFLTHGVRGLIYKGNRDGHCALPYDFSSVIPFAVSFDQGRTFQKRFNEELYNNIVDHPDVQFRYGGKYKAVFRAVRGFTMVRNDQKKYNIVNSKNDKLISPVWFEEVKGAIDPSNGTFGFTYRSYDFMGSIFSPEGSDGDGCVIDSDGDPFCEFSELDELVDSIRESGARDFNDFLRIISENQEDGNIANESIERLVNRLVESVLYEDRTVDADGTVTIDNFDGIKKLLNPDTQDDVWFVQIIKRHKDNPTLHFERNACDFVTYYLVHDANELEQKRSEIIAVCRATHSRAYIQPNKRSMISISDYATNVLKPRFEKYRDKYRKGHEIEVAAGQAKDWPDRKLCFLDVDSNDENVYKKVMQILNANGITPMWEYRSMNNGWHILLPDKEQVRNVDFSSIDNGVKMGMWSTVGLEIDKPLLLYASLKPNGYGVQQRVQQRKMDGGGHHRRR